jgi:hypothetical protein
MASGHLTAPHQKAGQMAAPTSTASPSKIPLPTGSRPQMARAHSELIESLVIPKGWEF